MAKLPQTARMEERYERYCELRDASLRPTDCRREIGISEGTGRKYERAWRRARGLAPAARPRFD